MNNVKIKVKLFLMGYFPQEKDKYFEDLYIKETKINKVVYVQDLQIGDELRYVHRSYDLKPIVDDTVLYFKVCQIECVCGDMEISFSNGQTVRYKPYDNVIITIDNP
jgi:hypothetical protein